MSDIHPTIVSKLNGASGTVRLGSTLVGSDSPAYFIAEIGNNHNGDFFIARRSIEEAARAGAHAVKFQKRSIPDAFARELRDIPLTKGEIAGRTYGEYRQALELSLDELLALKDVARSCGVDFFLTPFDLASLEFLDALDLPFYKIASFDVTNLPLIAAVASRRKPIILSTGMATQDEVDDAVMAVLDHHADLVILHCVSVYPSVDGVINLSAMRTLRTRYAPLPVGYSGHEQDILPSLAAVATGAAVVERHFTLSRRLPGPDHGTVSLEPAAFAEMVAAAARIRTVLGRSGKELLDSEQSARAKHAKSLVSTTVIRKGSIIREEMLVCKSPGYGLRPKELSSVVGRRAVRDIDEDTVVRREDIDWESA